jgi:polar amino acid transport system substrate-binding protein
VSTNRSITILSLIVLAAIAAIALLTNRPAAGDTLARAVGAGILRVGYANEAPFAYLDPSTGQVTGEAVEIMRTAAASLGIPRVEGVLTEFGALIPGLQAGRYDVIAAGMYITPQRAIQVAFSDPTYVVGEGFLVPRGNPLKLHGYADVIASPTARIGVVAGAVQHGYARQLGVPEDRIVVFPDNASGLAGLAAGRAEALGLTSLTIRDLLQRGASTAYESATPFIEPVFDGRPARGYGAYAMRNDDARLRDALNRELRTLLGTPKHRELVAPFGFGPEHLTKGATVEQVLAGTAP